MSELSIFEGNSLVSSDLFKSLQNAGNNLLGGSGGGMRRISVRGKRFRELVGSEEMRVSKSDSMNVVIVNAAPLSRTYYEGTYSPDNPSAPHCWSADTNVPSPDVPEDQRMAPRCMDCPMNVKGSGQGESRACRFQQRLAVALEGQLDKVYQLQLPATSVFGRGDDGKMPMQAYARFLNAHNTPPIAVVTEMYFDDDSDVPKLLFKPVRPLEEAELKQVAALLEHPDTERAITFSVSKPKGEEDVSAALTKPEPKPKKAKKAKVEEEEPEEPKKVAKKSDDASGGEDPELDAIVDAWDDED
tara:strand:+ start:6864 stop:7766 length:903 start_codon:yes stop_codon:yes gene_type:complete